MERRRLLSVKEAAEFLGVHASTLYRMLKRGEIESFKIGADLRFDPAALERWIASRPMAKTDSAHGRKLPKPGGAT